MTGPPQPSGVATTPDPKGTFEDALELLRKKGRFDAKGQHLTSSQVKQIMSAAREFGHGNPDVQEANFRNVTFDGPAHFEHARFTGRAQFQHATFTGKAHFEHACFLDEAHFSHATFNGAACFQDAGFHKYAHFPDTTFNDVANFLGADLKSGLRLGPSLLGGRLTLDNASLGDLDLRISGCELWCRGTRFHGPAHLKVRWAEIRLDDAVFDRIASLVFAPPWAPSHECKLPWFPKNVSEIPKVPIKGRGMPRAMSFDGADIGNLTLADVDLSSCSFKSTLRLDSMRLATLCPFDESPPGRRRAQRLRIHEENLWRDDPAVDDAAKARRRDEAERLAKVYRALRTGREDEGSAPGAGDFYYGEMEMRRHGQVGFFEHRVIWLYWLVSGYGLRASRALAALALTVLVFAGLFTIFDIRPRADFWDNMIFSLQGTTSLLRAPEALSTEGRFLEILLRLLGPLFVALAIISLRGRVKR